MTSTRNYVSIKEFEDDMEFGFEKSTSDLLTMGERIKKGGVDLRFLQDRKLNLLLEDEKTDSSSLARLRMPQRVAKGKSMRTPKEKI